MHDDQNLPDARVISWMRLCATWAEVDVSVCWPWRDLMSDPCRHSFTADCAIRFFTWIEMKEQDDLMRYGKSEGESKKTCDDAYAEAFEALEPELLEAIVQVEAQNDLQGQVLSSCDLFRCMRKQKKAISIFDSSPILIHAQANASSPLPLQVQDYLDVQAEDLETQITHSLLTDSMGSLKDFVVDDEASLLFSDGITRSMPSSQEMAHFYRASILTQCDSFFHTRRNQFAEHQAKFKLKYLASSPFSEEELELDSEPEPEPELEVQALAHLSELSSSFWSDGEY